MATKITRALQKIFGSTAASNFLPVIGSLAAGSKAYTTDPVAMQALSNFTGGWPSCVVGANSPAMNDANALDWLITRQLAYLMQQGVAEWDATTNYFIGSMASDGAGNFYISRTNSNLNNALTSTANWYPVIGPIPAALSIALTLSGINYITGNVNIVAAAPLTPGYKYMVYAKVAATNLSSSAPSASYLRAQIQIAASTPSLAFTSSATNQTVFGAPSNTIVEVQTPPVFVSVPYGTTANAYLMAAAYFTSGTVTGNVNAAEQTYIEAIQIGSL